MNPDQLEELRKICRTPEGHKKIQELIKEKKLTQWEAAEVYKLAPDHMNIEKVETLNIEK